MPTMRKKFNRKLAVITDNHVDSFPRTVISGIHLAAQARGFEISEYSYKSDTSNLDRITFDLSAFAGILVITDAIPDPALQAIYATGKPISLISHQVDDLNIPGVATDNIEGITELIKHLVVTCGRRNPVFIRGLMTHNDARQRESAFRREMIHYNIPVSETHFLRGDFWGVVAAESVRAFLSKRYVFDAIVAADYLMGIAAIETLREANIYVPEDVSVVGFGDGPEAETAGLTVVAANIVDLGICAVKQIIGQINGLPMSGTTVLGVQLIARNSCGSRNMLPSDARRL